MGQVTQPFPIIISWKNQFNSSKCFKKKYKLFTCLQLLETKIFVILSKAGLAPWMTGQDSTCRLSQFLMRLHHPEKLFRVINKNHTIKSKEVVPPKFTQGKKKPRQTRQYYFSFQLLQLNISQNIKGKMSILLEYQILLAFVKLHCSSSTIFFSMLCCKLSLLTGTKT